MTARIVREFVSNTLPRRALRRAPLLLCLVGLGSQVFAEDDAEPRLSAKSISARLYYHETATFGEDDPASGKLALWNSIIGEGDADHPTSAALVLVKLGWCSSCKGPNFLVFVATDESGRRLTDSKIPLSAYSSGQKEITLPFVVHGIGCATVNLEATVVGPNAAPGSATATLPFRCGE